MKDFYKIKFQENLVLATYIENLCTTMRRLNVLNIDDYLSIVEELPFIDTWDDYWSGIDEDDFFDFMYTHSRGDETDKETARDRKIKARKPKHRKY